MWSWPVILVLVLLVPFALGYLFPRFSGAVLIATGVMRMRRADERVDEPGLTPAFPSSTADAEASPGSDSSMLFRFADRSLSPEQCGECIVDLPRLARRGTAQSLCA